MADSRNGQCCWIFLPVSPRSWLNLTRMRNTEVARLGVGLIADIHIGSDDRGAPETEVVALFTGAAAMPMDSRLE